MWDKGKGTQVLFYTLEIIRESENSRARSLEDSLFWGLQGSGREY